MRFNADLRRLIDQKQRSRIAEPATGLADGQPRIECSYLDMRTRREPDDSLSNMRAVRQLTPLAMIRKCFSSPRHNGLGRCLAGARPPLDEVHRTAVGNAQRGGLLLAGQIRRKTMHGKMISVDRGHGLAARWAEISITSRSSRIISSVEKIRSRSVRPISTMAPVSRSFAISSSTRETSTPVPTSAVLGGLHHHYVRV